MKNKYPVGCIVTFKSHPLLYDFMIKGDGKLVPPFMIVKEVFIEDKKKKIVDDITGEQIAERIKYTCVFFDDNKTDFKDVILYESMLKSYEEIYIAKIDGVIMSKEADYKSLIKEASEYTVPKYNYGNIIYFKTKKFEIFKKRNSIKSTRAVFNEKEISELTIEEKNNKNSFDRKETIQYVVNYSTPEFILSGIKKRIMRTYFIQMEI